MGSYKASYETALALLKKDIQDAYSELDNIAEDQEEVKIFQQGVIRGLEWAVENLEINQPVN